MRSPTPLHSDSSPASRCGRSRDGKAFAPMTTRSVATRTWLADVRDRCCVLAVATVMSCAAGISLDALTRSARGQARNYSPRFRIETNGLYTMFGNAVTTCSTSPSNGGQAFFLCDDAQRGDRTDFFGTNNAFFMQYVDIDSDPSTFNSSSSDLTLPVPSNDVVWAGLYWSGDTSFGQDFSGLGIPTGSNAPTPSDNNVMLLRAPGDGSYRTIQADNIDTIGSRFSAVTDITNIVRLTGNGTYFGANIQAGTGPDRYGGWAIVVVYRDASEVLRNITVFDGFQQVGNNTVDSVVLNFLTPPTGVFDSSIGIIANEGDLGFSGDQFLIDGGRGFGFTPVGDALNPTTNFFNSSNTNLGSSVTSRNPSFENMLAVDINIVEASFVDPNDGQTKSILANGATSASLRFTSTGDFYFPTTLVFSTQVFQPVLTADFLKTVTDDDGGDVLPGDVLTYEVSFTNTGNDASTDTLFTDALPANTSFVSNSLEVLQDDANPGNVGAKSDIGDDEAEFDSANNQVIFRLGSGASSSQGGNLAIGNAVRVRFKVQVDPGISTFPTTISNQAEIDYVGASTGQPFTGISDDPSTTTNSDPTDIDVVPFSDYGDAPVSYDDTAGSGSIDGSDTPAKHAIANTLNLGSIAPDSESAPQSSAAADGDDDATAPNVDDEDGIGIFPTLDTDTVSYDLELTVNNDSGSAANVYAWIDFDGDGEFDEDERATVADGSIGLSGGQVPTGSNGTVTLNWTGIGTNNDIVNGDSFVRVRVTTDDLDITTETTERDDASVGSARDGEVEDFPLAIDSLTPLLKLVKRITAVNGADLTGFDSDDGRTEDEDPNWPTPASTYLRGAVSSGTVMPGDEVEFTIYFLSAGDAPIGNLRICDLVPDNMTFAPNAFNSLTPLDTNSLSGTAVGIALASDDSTLPTAPTVYLTNVGEGDRGQFVLPNSQAPASCNQTDFSTPLPAANNPRGAVVVDVVTGSDTLPPPTGAGTPTDAYGFIRFKAKTD